MGEAVAEICSVRGSAHGRHRTLAQLQLPAGIVTLYPIGGQPVRVDLDGQGGNSKLCAVALLTPEGGGLTVRREVQYVDGFHEALDRAYGWGMNWSRGSK